MHPELRQSIKFVDDHDLLYRDCISSQVLRDRSEAKENECFLYSVHYQDGSKCSNSLLPYFPYIQPCLPWSFLTQSNSLRGVARSCIIIDRPLVRQTFIPRHARVLLHKCGWLFFPSQVLLISCGIILLSHPTDGYCIWDLFTEVLYHGLRQWATQRCLVAEGHVNERMWAGVAPVEQLFATLAHVVRKCDRHKFWCFRRAIHRVDIFHKYRWATNISMVLVVHLNSLTDW